MIVHNIVLVTVSKLLWKVVPTSVSPCALPEKASILQEVQIIGAANRPNRRSLHGYFVVAHLYILNAYIERIIGGAA